MRILKRITRAAATLPFVSYLAVATRVRCLRCARVVRRVEAVARYMGGRLFVDFEAVEALCLPANGEVTTALVGDEGLEQGTVVMDHRCPVIVVSRRGTRRGLCAACARKGEVAAADLARTSPVEDLIQVRVWSHGLAAYHGGAEDNIACFLAHWEAGRTMELACSDRSERIGPIGLFLQGEVLVASPRDLGTWVSNGTRYLSVEAASHLVCRLEDLLQTRWSHKEAVVRPRRVLAVWVDRTAASAWHHMGQALAERLGVRLIRTAPSHAKTPEWESTAPTIKVSAAALQGLPWGRKLQEGLWEAPTGRRFEWRPRVEWVEEEEE